MLLERHTGGYVTVTWAASATSSPFQLLPGSAGSLSLPAGFTVATVTFEAEEPDGTWMVIHTAGAALTVTVTAGRRNILPEALFHAASGRIRAILSGSNTGTGYIHLVK